MVNTSRYDTTNGEPETLQHFLIPSESDTIHQRSYSTKLLPELLQTHDYARAFFDRCSAVMGMADDSETLALARLQRRIALDLPRYDFHMLIDEAALRVTVGSSEVMTTQIRHLMNILTARAHVRIGIIALNAEFLSPADSFDFSTATDSDNQRSPIRSRTPTPSSWSNEPSICSPPRPSTARKPTPSWPARWPATPSPASDPTDRPRGPKPPRRRTPS